MRSPLSCCIMICLSVEVGQLGAIDVISQHVLNLPGAPVILFGDGRFRMPATSVDHYRLIVGKDATIVKTPVKEAGILHGHARRSYDVNVNAWPRPLSTRPPKAIFSPRQPEDISTTDEPMLGEGESHAEEELNRSPRYDRNCFFSPINCAFWREQSDERGGGVGTLAAGSARSQNRVPMRPHRQPSEQKSFYHRIFK